MPLFQYKAYDRSGDITTGELEAPSADAVLKARMETIITVNVGSAFMAESL